MKFFESKQYLFGDFKIHVKNNSRIIDHCLEHALSDETCKELKSNQSHNHNISCNRCLLIDQSLADFDVKIDELKGILYSNA